RQDPQMERPAARCRSRPAAPPTRELARLHLQDGRHSAGPVQQPVKEIASLRRHGDHGKEQKDEPQRHQRTKLLLGPRKADPFPSPGDFASWWFTFSSAISVPPW